MKAPAPAPWRLDVVTTRDPSHSPTTSPLQDDGLHTPRRRSFNPSRVWDDDDEDDVDAKALSPSAGYERGPSAGALEAQPPSAGRRSRIPAWLPAYTPLIIWSVVSLLTALLVAIFHTHVFQGLDSLSRYLKQAGVTGYALCFACITLTTIPPCPFYGTLIVLSGYTFGVWRAFLVAYTAALFGAVGVYLFCRSFLRDVMQVHLRKSPGMRKVITACSKRPRLLFLIRLAPYPFNLVNALAAASDSLDLITYVACTALALPKLLVHTSIGASIHSWVQYHNASRTADAAMDRDGQRLKIIFGAVGIGLCIAVFIWLFYITRRAVDEADEKVDRADVKPSAYGPGLSPGSTSAGRLLSVDIDDPR